MASGQFVIVAYVPRPGKEADLRALVRDHVGVLRSQGLVTDRAPVFLESSGGALIEMFEWRSAEAVEAAHANEAVREMWTRFDAACEYGTFAALPEAQGPFATFKVVDLGGDA